VSYAERQAIAPLAGHVACVWTTSASGPAPRAILPDACFDLVHGRAGGLFVAGPDTHATVVDGGGPGTVVGARFWTGAGAELLGVPATALRDARVPLAELWGEDALRLEDELADAGGATALRAAALERALVRRARRAGPPDALVGAAVGRIRRDAGAPVGRLGFALGVSERQLRRRVAAAAGYGPKTLARILRFQRLLRLAERPGAISAGLAWLALEAGYADQAHMTAECSALAGEPPRAVLGRRPARGDVRFLKDRARPAA
jgi:methylphosphotriester-DNA--protein-cysteine methyltransferase